MILVTVPNWVEVTEGAKEFFKVRIEAVHIFDKETGLSLK
jgi:hypothetical protein